MKINLFDITASKRKRQHLNSIGQTPNFYFALSQGEPWQSPSSWPVLFSHLIMHPGFVVSLDHLLPLIHGFCARSPPPTSPACIFLLSGGTLQGIMAVH